MPLKAGAKSGHNDELSKKERAHYRDELEAGVLGDVLASDAHFQEQVATLFDLLPPERLARAWEQARAYAPYDGPRRNRIRRHLLAACASWEDSKTMPSSTAAERCRTVLLNLEARAVWAEAPLEDTDARRVRYRQDRLREGALYVALFGAYRCINCGALLAQDSRSGRSHPTHCSPCSAVPWEAGRQREAMWDALDAGTDRRRVRRAKRRAPA